MSRRAVKIVAVSYAVKTALIAGLWLAAPDVARQATDKLRTAWVSLTSDKAPPPAP